MIRSIQFEFPLALQAGLPLVAVVLGWVAWRQRRAGLSALRVALLGFLRGLPLLVLVVLAARPFWILKEPPAAATRSVLLLMDRSESMALEERAASRYAQAIEFLRQRLLPTLKSSGIPVQAMLFDEVAEVADGDALGRAAPKGKRTNLAGAIAQGIASSSTPPLAVVALTDGIVNDSRDNVRALTSLVDNRVPFIGIGFGDDLGVRTLTLRDLEVPGVVGTKTAFTVAAQLEMMNTDEAPPFEMVLFRDGQMVQKKTVSPGKGSRTWLESFRVIEEKQGVYSYTVQLLPPNLPDLKCVNMLANASVRVSDEKELRILYIQGALTWDYKFIGRALLKDPTIKLTGLTRTSKQSVFRQNVESTGELLNGFPATLEELAPFRVVILSNLKPADLTPEQQNVLARFCGELGGGVLMIGGPDTFSGGWQKSRLEQLLPVVVSAQEGVTGLDQPFRLQVTPEALDHPVFQIAEGRPPREAWAQLPAFTGYGRVDAAKPGAQVWALHQSDDGPAGRRILMASQRYGAGLSAIIAVQNFWRWRMAEDADSVQFDRFWRQLFRFLSESGRQDVSIHLAEQDLRPGEDVRVIVEKQPNPKNVLGVGRKFFVWAEDPQKQPLREEALELEVARPVEFRFHAAKPGIYTITAADSQRFPLATRQVEIRDVNIEFQATARNMESLRQWASVSEGLAVKAEECDANELVAQVRAAIEQVRQGKQVRRPAGVNEWGLALVIGCLGAEWLLRKKWGLA